MNGLVLFLLALPALVAGSGMRGGSAGRDLLVPRRGVQLTTPCGMQAEVSQKLLDYGATIINELIATELSKVAIPEISGEKDGFNYDVKNCKVTASISTPKASFVAGQGVTIDLAGVNLNAHCDWSYKLHDWPHVPDGSGSLDAKAGGSTAVGATVAAAIVGGKIVLTASQINVNIDDFSVSIHGSIFSWLYDLIVDAFKGTIKDDIANAAKGAIQNVIDTTLNQELASLDLLLDIPFPAPYNIAEIDFTVVEIDVAADSAAVGTRSSVNDTRHPTTDPYPVPPVAIPAAPPAVRDASMITISISQWPINNGFWVFSEAGLLEYAISAAQIPASSPKQLNTGSFSDVAPGLYKAYPNSTMGLLLTVPPGFQEVAHVIDGQGVGVVDLPIQFNFSVFPNNATPAIPAFSVQCPANASANASISATNGTKAQKIHLDVTDLSCTPVAQVSSAFGNVSAVELDILVGFLLADLLPTINGLLAPGFALPGIDGVSLVNSAIKPVNGTLQITSDISWTPTMLA